MCNVRPPAVRQCLPDQLCCPMYCLGAVKQSQHRLDSGWSQLMRQVKVRCMRAPIGCGGEVRDVVQPSPSSPPERCLLQSWSWWHLPGELRRIGLSRASSWLACVLICSQPAQAAPDLSNNRNPPSLPPHDASRFFQRPFAGHLHLSVLHATGSFPLAPSLSALPEPHSISLRLHHCTSPSTHPHPRAW